MDALLQAKDSLAKAQTITDIDNVEVFLKFNRIHTNYPSVWIVITGGIIIYGIIKVTVCVFLEDNGSCRAVIITTCNGMIILSLS